MLAVIIFIIIMREINEVDLEKCISIKDQMLSHLHFVEQNISIFMHENEKQICNIFARWELQWK